MGGTEPGVRNRQTGTWRDKMSLGDIGVGVLRTVLYFELGQ